MPPSSYGLPALTSPALARLLLGLVGNPSAPPEVLVRLTKADIDRSALAQRRDLPTDAATVLATDPDTVVRSALASNSGIPPAVQVLLGGDADPQVRINLAQGRDHFTTVGMYGRINPGPLPQSVYELLARDPDPDVRRALALNRHLPDALRAGMLDDADPRTAAAAVGSWPSVPVDRIGGLLARTTDAFGREMLLHRLEGPLPTAVARTMLVEIDSAAGAPDRADLLRLIAEVAQLDVDMTERFLAAPELRAAVAANPTLSDEHVANLARDPDDDVRVAVVARRGLDPELRESIPVEYEDRSTAAVDWLLTEPLSERDQLAFARSRHQIFRKSLAMRTGVPDEVVEVLAHDESFAVRLFVCERQPNAPGWLLAQVAEQWQGYSRWDMLAHRNFPADAATGLARSGDPYDRAVAAAHPALPTDTIEALLTDTDKAVRGRAALNPAIPANRLIGLLGAADAFVAAGAAANPGLPVSAMRQLLDQAGL